MIQNITHLFCIGTLHVREKDRSPCDAYGDLVPTPQQELPYQQLSLCDGVITSFQELPNCGHSLCGARSCGAEAAIDWINEQWS